MKLTESRVAMIMSAGLLIAAVLACGGGASRTPTGAAPTTAPVQGAARAAVGIHDIVDPCHLLDQTDATKFFGHAANAGDSNFGSNNANCGYTSATAGDELALNVLYEDGPAKDCSDYTSVKTSDTQPVPGLGDDANFNSAFHLLTVAKGHWMVSVNAFWRDEPGVGSADAAGAGGADTAAVLAVLLAGG